MPGRKKKSDVTAKGISRMKTLNITLWRANDNGLYLLNTYVPGTVTLTNSFSPLQQVVVSASFYRKTRHVDQRGRCEFTTQLDLVTPEDNSLQRIVVKIKGVNIRCKLKIAAFQPFFGLEGCQFPMPPPKT